MKKKTKISKLLTDQQLEKISHLSKLLGKDKYFETITKVIKEFIYYRIYFFNKRFLIYCMMLVIMKK